jgi:hypothetical protein
MINKVLILVCSTEDELELAYETLNQFGHPSVGVVRVSELEDEVALVNVIRDFIPIHFYRYEPRDGFSKEFLIHEELRNIGNIGMVGHGLSSRLVSHDLPSRVAVCVPYEVPRLTIDELISLQINETREHILTLREDVNCLFFEEKDDHRPWKNVGKNISNLKCTSGGNYSKMHQSRCHRGPVLRGH